MKTTLLIVAGVLAALLYSWSDFKKSLGTADATRADGLPIGDKGRLAVQNLGYVSGLSNTRATLPATTT
jgi:hypothetical protein